MEDYSDNKRENKKSQKQKKTLPDQSIVKLKETC